jgi:hypothetical protein
MSEEVNEERVDLSTDFGKKLPVFIELYTDADGTPMVKLKAKDMADFTNERIIDCLARYDSDCQGETPKYLYLSKSAADILFFRMPDFGPPLETGMSRYGCELIVDTERADYAVGYCD